MHYGVTHSASLHTMGNTGCGLRRHGGSGIENSPEWWAKMGGFGWAYARQGALWVPKEKPTGGPGGG